MVEQVPHGVSNAQPGADLNGPNDVMKRYAEERSKRLNEKGLKQYLDPAKSEKYKHFLEDPWVKAGTSVNQPVKDGGHTKILIFGAGHGGILFAVNLIKAGFTVDDIVIVDPAGGFGGTWYWNRYPGIMCDIESYIYMPLLEEFDYVPTRRYASGEEIRLHCEMICGKYDLHKRAMFQSRGESLVWDEKEHIWRAQLALQPKRGNEEHVTISADYVILATGLLVNAQLPDVPGLDAFAGHSFHTSRWDYEYTGGSPAKPDLTGLKGKKVALVGTGASGVQAVPHLAKWAKELYVFQRTPASVDVRDNHDTDPATFKSEVASKPGWWKERNENLMMFMNMADPLPEVNLVNDGWTRAPTMSALCGGPKQVTMETVGEHIASLHAMDLPRTERIRQRVRDTVKDAATAESLQANYPTWCKRPCFHDEYLPTFNQEHVHLVDTRGKSIDAVAEKGVDFGGKVYDVDVIVWGTGFITPFVGTAAGKAKITVTGPEGRDFEAINTSGDLDTLHGVCARGFPNLFWPGISQAAVTGNQTYSLDNLSKHITYIIAQAEKNLGRKKAVIEPTLEAQEEWANIIAGNAFYFAPLVGCTPGYYNAEGEMDKMPPEMQAKAARHGLWGYGYNSFTKKLEGWRAEGGLQGLEVKAAA